MLAPGRGDFRLGGQRGQAAAGGLLPSRGGTAVRGRGLGGQATRMGGSEGGISGRLLLRPECQGRDAPEGRMWGVLCMPGNKRQDIPVRRTILGPARCCHGASGRPGQVRNGRSHSPTRDPLILCCPGGEPRVTCGRWGLAMR